MLVDIIRFHFESHIIANAIKCDMFVNLVTTNIEEGRHETDYDVEIEKGTPMIKVSLLIEDLVDKMRIKCNVIVNGEPSFNNIIFIPNSTDENMEIISVDYFVEYESVKSLF